MPSHKPDNPALICSRYRKHREAAGWPQEVGISHLHLQPKPKLTVFTLAAHPQPPVTCASGDPAVQNADGRAHTKGWNANKAALTAEEERVREACRELYHAAVCLDALRFALQACLGMRGQGRRSARSVKPG